MDNRNIVERRLRHHGFEGSRMKDVGTVVSHLGVVQGARNILE
ncbi:MAG: hypothetical protein ACMUEM_00085 [Flavobacteriales bacterium AspAUS03]